MNKLFPPPAAAALELFRGRVIATGGADRGGFSFSGIGVASGSSAGTWDSEDIPSPFSRFIIRGKNEVAPPALALARPLR
ncbi:hypothetical protein AGABI2DRAFT_134481 [Agaricus bisporus var. bisporus H97]|uniref:hypothetical protein n=1 Tax=Agaricus bisporus var. bisporus (strain H97 / ATCC MYA-4626 / FGSC 10389) TaxID=936046 RepID=UPI00029F71DE|nr:hypothetical protein AGABI2DRAFT_134481 [Agaricus bisporus var. bisporus H97]EKV48806.1 hypothetical protein AGABI2DRAFT_134481 [Agaricus bisporus var. bisporus H97]